MLLRKIKQTPPNPELSLDIDGTNNQYLQPAALKTLPLGGTGIQLCPLSSEGGWLNLWFHQ